MRMTQKQFRLADYTLNPSWVGTLTLIICASLFIKLGLWQYNKAILKQEIKSIYEKSLVSEPLNLPEKLESYDVLRYKKIKTKGYYDTKYQILLDNQVENNVAGFHVLTPLKIEGRADYVLINRGWVAGGEKHSDIPAISTPKEIVEITGLVWIPSKKNFSLESDAEKVTWNQVWQYMNMDRYRKDVPIPVLPIVIKLDSNSNAGGFVRNWQVSESRISTNMGYAYQWFGFAFASLLIYLYTSIKKTSTPPKTQAH
ncbi:MAG: SURF1 family protein [Methylotenera sp.]|nr:SURF1 family protein [Methylotenera sp.]